MNTDVLYHKISFQINTVSTAKKRLKEPRYEKSVVTIYDRNILTFFFYLNQTKKIIFDTLPEKMYK